MAKKYIAIAKKGQEFFYNKNTVIQCTSGKQATSLSEHLNTHNETSKGIFKCKDGEVWHTFEDLEPVYKVKSTKGKITITVL